MLTGKNGILTQATNAKEKTSKAEEEEKVNMAVLGSSIVDNGYADILGEESFKKELTNQFGNSGYNLVVNGDGSFIITIKDSQRKYYVNDDKTVINSDNIIEISTAEELASFRDDVNNGNSYEGKAVLLTDDITLDSNVEYDPIGYYDQATEDIKYPDTDTNKAFRGIFDGSNKEIRGITITSSDEICHGLFGLVIGGTIRNVIIGEDNNISGSQRTAGVVGYLYGFEGDISNCINYSNIIGGENTAGIVGNISGQHTIYNCKNYGTISGSGGIVGGTNGTNWEQFTNLSNAIINCGNYGSVTKNGYYCGGIVGYVKGDILNCCNKGKVTNLDEVTGGIAGTVDGKIENCYNTKDIVGRSGVGGIIGSGTEKPGTSLYNCYTIGNVSGKYSGQIYGWTSDNSIIKEQINCYTKNDEFTEKDLGDAFKEDSENINGGYPLLYWE